MNHLHAIVWIDHRRARVMHMSPLPPNDPEEATAAELLVVESRQPRRKVHLKFRQRGSGRLPIDHVFFDEVVSAIGETEEVMVVGPGVAKTEFVNDVTRRHPQVARRIVSVTTVDHPTDGQLLAFARQEFARIDAMRPQR